MALVFLVCNSQHFVIPLTGQDSSVWELVPELVLFEGNLLSAACDLWVRGVPPRVHSPCKVDIALGGDACPGAAVVLTSNPQQRRNRIL